MEALDGQRPVLASTLMSRLVFIYGLGLGPVEIRKFSDGNRAHAVIVLLGQTASLGNYYK